MTIKFHSSNTVSLDGPTNIETDALSSGGTCVAYLFSDRKDAYLRADEAIGQTVLSVSDASQYEIGVDSVAIQRDDKVWHLGGLVTAVNVDPANQTVTITNSLATDAAAKGAAVCVILGGSISMAAYGTPVLGTFDWGYRGTVPITQAGLRVGLPVRTEITLTDSGVVLTKILRDTVEGGS